MLSHLFTKATPSVPPSIITPVATPSQTVSEEDNMTLSCGSQLSPYVDTPVGVAITWTGPGGGGLMGSSTALLGGTYQSSLLVMSLSPDRTGTYNCSMSVLPNNSPYVTGTENYKTIEGKRGWFLHYSQIFFFFLTLRYSQLNNNDYKATYKICSRTT